MEIINFLTALISFHISSTCLYFLDTFLMTRCPILAYIPINSSLGVSYYIGKLGSQRSKNIFCLSLI